MTPPSHSRTHVVLEVPVGTEEKILARMEANHWRRRTPDGPWRNAVYFPNREFTQAEAIGAEIERYRNPLAMTAGPESAITAPANTLRRAIEVVVDEHVSHGQLRHGSLALVESLLRAVENHEPDHAKALAKSKAHFAELMTKVGVTLPPSA